MLVFRKMKIPMYEYEAVFGSRKVIKDSRNPNQQHFYGRDLWTEYGERIADLIPEGVLVYGELIGWTKNAEGQDIPIQKNYTYHLKPGEVELYVYRVAVINAQGHMVDLSWDGVKEFCKARGLKWTPELCRVGVDWLEEWLETVFLDRRYADDLAAEDTEIFNDQPLPLSDKKTVDEGVCLRQEGLVPLILKAKSPRFLEHETRLLDKGEADIESQEVA